MPLKKVQENQVGLKLNGTHDGVKLLDDNIDTIRKNTQTLIDASKEVGLEVNTEKTKYMLLYLHWNAGQNHDIKIGNRCFENVTQFRYLGTPVTNQNFIHEEIKRRLNSVHKLLSSRLLSKSIKIRIIETIFLSVVLYGCQTLSLTLR
jgi:hypothetical protein